LSSGTALGLLFNYANQTALSLFELDWNTLVELPAHESAKPVHQSTRAKLMRQIQETEFIEDYSGIRISTDGWPAIHDRTRHYLDVIDGKGIIHDQAATCSHWRDL